MPRALIVDDEKSIRLAFSRRLAKSGIETDVADGWIEAEPLIRLNEYDVIFLDVMMPGKDGIAILKEIMQIQPLTNVVMMTGDPSIQKAIDSYKSGAVDYLKKPVSKDKLLKFAFSAVERRELMIEKKRLEGETQNFEKRLDNLLSEKTGNIGGEDLKSLAEDLIKHRKRSSEDLKAISAKLGDALEKMRKIGKDEY